MAHLRAALAVRASGPPRGGAVTAAIPVCCEIALRLLAGEVPYLMARVHVSSQISNPYQHEDEMRKIYHALFLSPLLFGIGCAIPDDNAQEPSFQTDDALSERDSLTPSAAATEGGHVCNILARDGVTEGVHCADWAFVRTSATTFEVWGVGESLCQPSGGGPEERCSGIKQNVNIYVNDLEQAGQGHLCGVLGGSDCPMGNVRFSNTSGHAPLTIPVGGRATIQAGLVNDEFVLATSPTVPRVIGPNVFSSRHDITN
jgi:hypothetical protein